MLLDQEPAFWRWVQHLCTKVNSRFRCSRGGEYLNHRAVTGNPTYMYPRARVFASAVGSQIEFVHAAPVSYLVSPVVRDVKFDFVVLCYYTWYFSLPDMLPQVLAQVREAGTPIVLIPKNALSASHPDAVPYMLVALAVNALESFRAETRQRNIP